jgi:hypothetical protein
MIKSQHSMQKRHKELARLKKAEEKRRRRQEKKNDPGPDQQENDTTSATKINIRQPEN